MVYKVVTTQYFQEDPAKIGNFHARARDLWNDYVWRNRTNLVSTMTYQPEMVAAQDWMMVNIQDFYNTINDYYGEDAARRWREVMDAQRIDMMQLLDYVKKPPANFNINTDAFVQELGERLKSKSGELFDLMATLNSRWNLINVKMQLVDITESWLSQIKMRLVKNWNEDLAALDKTFDVARQVATEFANGIVEQFPDKFAMTP